MALKPQLLAGFFVALIASNCKRPTGRPLDRSAGPDPGPPMVYATAQAPFAAPAGNSTAYNPSAPPFAQTQMGPQSGEMRVPVCPHTRLPRTRLRQASLFLPVRKVCRWTP